MQSQIAIVMAEGGVTLSIILSHGNTLKDSRPRYSLNRSHILAGHVHGGINDSRGRGIDVVARCVQCHVGFSCLVGLFADYNILLQLRTSDPASVA